MSFAEFAQDEIEHLADLTAGLQERAEFASATDSKIAHEFVVAANAEAEARFTERKLERAGSQSYPFARESERAALNEWRESSERARTRIEDAEARLQAPAQRPVAQASM